MAGSVLLAALFEFWAMVIIAPLYAALVVFSHLGPGDPDAQLGADVWFEPGWPSGSG